MQLVSALHPLIWTCRICPCAIPSACVVPGVITESLFFTQFYSRLKEQSRITRVLAVTNAFGLRLLFTIVSFPSFQSSSTESASTSPLSFSRRALIPFLRMLTSWMCISTSPCRLNLCEVSMVAVPLLHFGNSFQTCSCFVSPFISSSSSVRYPILVPLSH